MTAVRAAGSADARVLAVMLDAFNREFDSPSPGPDVLETRLGEMLAREEVSALLAGDPPIGLALLTFRPSVWDAGPATLLEELYVRPDERGQGTGHALLTEAMRLARERGSETFEINVDEGDTEARRFYEAHGFSEIQPETNQRAFYYSRRLGDETEASRPAPGSPGTG